MTLVRAETRRLWKRRSTKIMLALAVLILGGTAVAMSLASHPRDAGTLAAAEQRAQREYEQQLHWAQQYKDECERVRASGQKDPSGIGADKYPPDCSMIEGPSRSDLHAEWFLPYEFNFGTDFENLLVLLAGVLVMVGFVVGATYVGAEWNSGAMMNLLLWRPDRVRVILTKLGVALGGLLTGSVLLGALWTFTFWLIGKYDGTLGTLTPGVWRSLALTGARAVTVGLVATAVGFALASIGRHTAMALGSAVGVVLLSEVGLRVAMQIVQRPFSDRWMLSTYAIAWMNKSHTLVNWRACDFSAMGECRPDELVITWQHAGWLFATVVAVLVAVTAWTMRRRDVT